MLLRRLQLQSASFQSSGRFSQQLLRADTDSIRALYTSNGFRDVQVSSKVDDNYGGKKNNLRVLFQIVEGRQIRIAALQIEGNREIRTADLLNVTGSTAGQPYSDATIASDRNNILAMYYNSGFPEARFQDDVEPAAELDEVHLVYHIVEGRRIEVAKVLLTGYQFTRPGIIAREVEIKGEAPLREGDIVDTQRRLYNLGVFDRVQIAPQNPNGTNPQKAVVVDTEEGRRYTLGYGAGFEVQSAGRRQHAIPTERRSSASPRGIFELARSNMFEASANVILSLRRGHSTLQYRGTLG